MFNACAGIIQEPMKLTWNTALEETEMVLFETVHKLFKTTGVSPQDVSSLILPCPHTGRRPLWMPG